MDNRLENLPFETTKAYRTAKTATEILGNGTAEQPEEQQAEPWPVLDENALHGLAGELVRTIDPYTEADPMATLLNFLVGFGNCINAGPHAVVQHDRHPGRLFVVQVGATSKGRKGTGWSTPRYSFSLLDPDWVKDRVQEGLSSAEGLIYHVRDALYKKQPVKEKGRVVDYESVLTEEAVDDKRLLLIESEFALTLTVMGREGNTLSATLRNAWDRGDLSTLTRNSPLKATGAHVSVIGHITKQELLARLDDTSKANGFANRFLWALVRRSKELPEGGSVPEAELAKLVVKLRKARDFALKVSELKRTEEARELWRTIYHDLSEGKPGMYGAIVARGEAQVLRLSVLYALLDCSDVITTEHLNAALAVWDYCEDSARIIFGDAIGDPTADAILSAIRKAGDSGMSDSEISDLFGRNKNASDLDRAKRLLLSLRKVFATKTETSGRPRNVYRSTN